MPDQASDLARRFVDRSVLITGAASGIGRATAIRLAREGARLFAVDVDEAALAETANEVSKAAPGAEIETRLCDVSDEAEVKACVGAARDAHGGIDVLCNVAGILVFEHTHDLDLARWQRVLDVNLTGAFLFCREALPSLLERGGNIVNTSSTSALRGLAYAAAYAASKGGLLALTSTLAIEYGKRGVRANAVCPGNIDTPMSQKVRFPENIDGQLIVRSMALDKARGPETVASVIALLASDDGAHINGEFIRMDGAASS